MGRAAGGRLSARDTRLAYQSQSHMNATSRALIMRLVSATPGRTSLPILISYDLRIDIIVELRSSATRQKGELPIQRPPGGFDFR